MFLLSLFIIFFVEPDKTSGEMENLFVLSLEASFKFTVNTLRKNPKDMAGNDSIFNIFI